MDNGGKSGCSRQTDFNQNDRPLKKAKYVWEVKGKYHLKSNETHKIEESGKDICCGCGKANDVDEAYKDKCIDALLAKTESILDNDEDTSSQSPQGIESSITPEIPVSLVCPQPEDDHYLEKWQARQIARGYIDNTINSVLENWSNTNVPFDAEDFVENCINDGHVEDEAILMAIQAHGLQSTETSNKNKPLAIADQVDETYREKIDIRNEMDFVYPLDILNTAILAAIEKEGLSSTSS